MTPPLAMADWINGTQVLKLGQSEWLPQEFGKETKESQCCLNLGTVSGHPLPDWTKEPVCPRGVWSMEQPSRREAETGILRRPDNPARPYRGPALGFQEISLQCSVKFRFVLLNLA